MRNPELLNALSNCINYCNYCADACLDENNVEEMVTCIRPGRICASVCSATADVIATHYPARELVKYCQEMCETCARECNMHPMHHCQECARACEEYLA